MSPPRPSPADRQEARSRRTALTTLAVFAAIVILMNTFMITMAVRTFSGLAVDNAPARGLHYNRTLAEAEDQAERGWQSEIRFLSKASMEGTVSVRLVDAAGQPLDGGQVAVALVRPTRAGSDVRAELAGTGDGTYRTDIALPAAGVWDAYLVARTAQGSYHRRERLMVP